ncbi:hypothetical protein C8J57DRAFT_1498969 [Mycena rebaudengoi]|nr:hypothetical protein C8J57DRAFT_1498969 [Mycena rebaudengoi]
MLRPRLFLPDNSDTSRKPYYLETGSPFLVDSSGQRLDTLPFKSQRTPDDALSMLRCSSTLYKLQALPRTNELPEEIEDYASTISSLFKLIFFIPDTLVNRRVPPS